MARYSFGQYIPETTDERDDMEAPHYSSGRTQDEEEEDTTVAAEDEVNGNDELFVLVETAADALADLIQTAEKRGALFLKSGADQAYTQVLELNGRATADLKEAARARR